MSASQGSIPEGTIMEIVDQMETVSSLVHQGRKYIASLADDSIMYT